VNNTLENYKNYPELTEAYEVVKTVEVVHNRKIYRIDVLKCYSNPSTPYTVNCWKYESVVMQPSGTNSEGQANKPQEMRVLVRSSLPAVNNTQDVESTLNRALRFLTNLE